eukprot:scaffold61948_cov33-Tisochrysis_lutea.AAC.3
MRGECERPALGWRKRVSSEAVKFDARNLWGARGGALQQEPSAHRVLREQALQPDRVGLREEVAENEARIVGADGIRQLEDGWQRIGLGQRGERQAVARLLEEVGHHVNCRLADDLPETEVAHLRKQACGVWHRELRRHIDDARAVRRRAVAQVVGERDVPARGVGAGIEACASAQLVGAIRRQRSGHGARPLSLFTRNVGALQPARVPCRSTPTGPSEFVALPLSAACWKPGKHRRDTGAPSGTVVLSTACRRTLLPPIRAARQSRRVVLALAPRTAAPSCLLLARPPPPQGSLCAGALTRNSR